MAYAITTSKTVPLRLFQHFVEAGDRAVLGSAYPGVVERFDYLPPSALAISVSRAI